METIVILGGGYSGVKTAKNILERTKNNNNIKVILIDRKDFQCLLPSLPSAISNNREKIIINFKDTFGKYKNFEFIKGEIESIDFKDQKVILSNGKTVYYNHLVIAFGAQPTDFGVEGVRQHAIMFWNEEDLKEYITKLNKFITQGKSPKIIIVGAGAVGVEVASETSHFLRKNKITPDILIIEAKDRCLPTLPEKLSKPIEKYLLKNQIKLVYNSPVIKVDEKKVYSKTGEEFEYDILLWCSGVIANSIIKSIESKSGFTFEKGPQGRIIVDEYLRVKNLHNVWAVGDIAYPKNQKVVPIPLAQFAVQMADTLSKNIINTINKKELKKLSLKFKGIVITLSKFSAGALITKPFEIVIPPSPLGIILRKVIDLNYILSTGAKPEKYIIEC